MNKQNASRKRKRRVPGPLSICVHCGEKMAHLAYLPQAYEYGAELILIQHVPTMMCDACGQSYLMGPVLKEIEKALRDPSGYTTLTTVKMAKFAKARQQIVHEAKRETKRQEAKQ